MQPSETNALAQLSIHNQHSELIAVSQTAHSTNIGTIFLLEQIEGKTN